MPIFLYVYLEASQRYEIPNYQIIKTSLEANIMEHKEMLTQKFRQRWTHGHKCDVKGCQSVLVIDAGLKPYRKVCGAKLSGFREFKESEDIVITGCTAMPQPNGKYCMKHLDEESPIITADKLTNETKKVLRDRQTRNATYKEAGQDNMYVVESIDEVRKNKGKTEFKVKWLGFEQSDCTWEPEDSIPKFIREYYKDASKLKNKLPNPVIKHSKTLKDGSKYHQLSWGNEKGGQWLKQDWFDIANADGDLTNTSDDNTCNTRKSRDKRERRHTVGLFLGVFPCGIISLWDELYGSESTSQVYSVVLEFLSNLVNIIKFILYDDACHLVRYAINQMHLNEYCKAMGEIPM